MLTETDHELITAAVDGVLDPRQEVAFRRLVAESAEAAALFHQVQTHARRLRELRRVPAPAGLNDVVIARVRSLTPVTPSSQQPARRPTWMAYAVAASLLLAVSAGSFWVAMQGSNHGNQDGVAQRQALPKPVASNGIDNTVVPLGVTPEIAAAPRAVHSTGIEVVAVAPRHADLESAPSPRVLGPGDVIASGPIEEMPGISAVQVRVPLIASVADLDQPGQKKRMTDGLARDPAARLDLFVHDSLKAAEVFQAAARAAGISLIVDTVAQERIRKNAPTTWLVYTEALTADEIAGFLAHLAVQSRSSDPTPVFATAHLVPAQPNEQRDLRDLLGVDPGLWKRAKSSTPKPISAGTADQVASALLKNEKPAIFLSYVSVNGRVLPGWQKDVKAFLDRRDERKPTAVPLVIVIRPVS